MGSCSEDCKVEEGSVTLGDGDADWSLEVGSEDNEARQLDLGRGKELAEEVVSLNGINCGVTVHHDCAELGIRFKETETANLGVMGADEENGHLELEKATDVSVLKNDFEGFDGCGDRNLRVDSEDFESKQVNLGSEDGERERETGHLELEKAFAEEAGSSIYIDSGGEVGKDCRGLVEKESGHLGLEHTVNVSVSKKDSEGWEVEAHPTSNMVDVLNNANGDDLCNDYENEQRKLVGEMHEAEEEGQGIFRVVEDKVHGGIEHSIKLGILWKGFNHCEIQPPFANSDASDQSNGASVDSRRYLKNLALEKKFDDMNFPEYTRGEKESEIIGLGQKLEVKAAEQVSEKSDCFCHSSYVNVDESMECKTGDSVHILEVMNNAVSFDIGSGSGESASGKKEAENECWEDVGSYEETEHLGLQQDSKSVSHQEHDEFPGLSPLRKLGGGDFARSAFGMGSEVGLLSPGVFNRDGIRNGSEDAEILVSSGLATDCSLLRIGGDASETADGPCFPCDDLRGSEASCMAERCEELYSFRNEKLDFSQCSQADKKGRSDSKSNPIFVFRRSNPKRSASLRSNLADAKYNQSITGNNRRKAVHISPAFLLDAIKISDKLKRKRSSHRLARHSLWGPFGNLIKIFEENAKLANYDADKIHVQKKRSKKGMSTVCRKNQAKSQEDGSFQASSANHSATADKLEVRHKWAGDNFLFTVESLQRDRQLVDKDVESSLTQEASVELGELPGVSSQIAPEMLVETVSDRNFLDPGTSPDSDVYHPAIDAATITSEVANSVDQDISTKDVIIRNDSVRTTPRIQFSGMGQNMHVLEAVSEDGLHSVFASSTETFATSSLVPPQDPNLCAKAKKGKKSDRHIEQRIVENLHGPDNLNNTKLPKCSKSKHKKQAVINRKNGTCSKSIRKTSQKGSKDQSFPHRSSVFETTDLECIADSVKVQDSLEKYKLPAEDFTNTQKGHKFSSGTKPGTSKGISHCRETAGRKRENAHGKTGKSVRKSDSSCDTKERSQTVDASMDAGDHMSFSSGALKPPLTMATQQNCDQLIPNDSKTSLEQLIPNDSKTSLEQPLPPQGAWVLCDDCEKWRCISVELANTLEETKSKWTCKDNSDKAFSDCSIPQEKTNAEINAELGILDEQDPLCVEPFANGVEPSKLVASKRTSWTPIKSNVFLHRNRKTQTIDEIMVCHCKPPRDGHWGCGDQCLNRMLNIECAKGTCPCGDLCSNQRFQKRKYAKFKWLRFGKKGYGLQLQDDASQGQFLIEYVGEVLDLATYDARQKYYASHGQKHFYFMTLNGGEVIDACAKGNLGRFINHSCEPNCRTEKWMVNGEVCIGLFAIRDIKKGEEVTFDYNYVRVVGAAAKKCICGSSECRGYLGGDPLNSEIIVQSDSDEEDIEPVTMNKKGQRELNLDDSISNANDVKIPRNNENSLERKEFVSIHAPAIPEPEVCAQNEDGVCRTRPEVNPLDTCLRSLDPTQVEDISSRPDTQPVGDSEESLNSAPVDVSIHKLVSDIRAQDISVEASSTTNAVLSDSVINKHKPVTGLFAEKPNISKSHSLSKSSHSRGTIKRGRSSVKNMVSVKPKTFAAGVGSGHFEGVEAKLNELLEKGGGISKQKDATRGYLKLLFVTAAEGDVGGRASQSTRDLSLILDAILKTKSRKVLVDIINKNGLQMLHNIMKQNRGNFNRIPILRKLLKVLEFLAFTGILTPELINKDPPYDGMESFKVSILKLANHSDKQVHKIAREFRDKWIPRSIRRIEPSDRDSLQLDRQIPHHRCIQPSVAECQEIDATRDTDAIVIVGTADHGRSVSSIEQDYPGGTSSSYNSRRQVTDDNRSASGTKARKRKSRWDHPSDITTADPQDHIFEEPGPKFSKCAPGLHNGEDGTSSQDLLQLNCDDGRPPGFFDGGDDDGPPGFQNNHHSQNSPTAQTTAVTGEEWVMGHRQEIYLSHMTMSYGIPVALMQQFGTPETGENRHQCSNQNLSIAPGMPFHPFPPLPSYPRKSGRPQIDTDLRLPSPSEGGAVETSAGSRNSVFSGKRLRFPNNGGRGAMFVHPQRGDNSNNKRRRFQNCWPRGPNQRLGRGGFGGGGSIRNGIRNVRGGFGQGLCPPDGVNNNYANSGFHQPHR